MKPSTKSILSKVNELMSLAIQEHYYCEDDSYYSCPLARDPLAPNGYYDIAEVLESECNCGADEHNAKVYELVAKLQEAIEREDC